MNPPLLHTCARATTFPGLVDRIVADCARTTDWQDMLTRAEAQGIAPLLHWHLQPLDTGIPAQFRRGIRLLYLRHQHTAGAYARVLREVLDLLGQAGIEALVLKGAALRHTVYPEIGLRPMRDIDLLLNRDQAQPAQDLLKGQGMPFRTRRAPLTISTCRRCTGQWTASISALRSIMACSQTVLPITAGTTSTACAPEPCRSTSLDRQP